MFRKDIFKCEEQEDLIISLFYCKLLFLEIQMLNRKVLPIPEIVYVNIGFLYAFVYEVFSYTWG